MRRCSRSFAALIIGVTPALKATGAARAGTAEAVRPAAAPAGLKFGGVWTGVIVTQVAVTVVFLADRRAARLERIRHQRRRAAAEFPGQRVRRRAPDAGSRADGDMRRAPRQAEAEYRDQFRATYAELSRRLAAEPAVAAIDLRHAPAGDELPGLPARGRRRQAAPTTRRRSSHARQVGVNYFDTFQAPIVAGRAFSEADLAPGRNVAIVDQTFVRQVFNGQDAIGRHVRDGGDEGKQPGPWLEIVGVVDGPDRRHQQEAGDSMLFRPAPPERCRRSTWRCTRAPILRR